MTAPQFSQRDRLSRLLSVYLLRKGTTKTMWTHAGIVNETRCRSRDIMDGYFLDFSRDADYAGPFDAQGVPMIDYTGRIGPQYNPWYVGHYALANFELFRKTNDAVRREKFLSLASWLEQNLVERNGGHYGVWEYKFDWSPVLRAPWISSLSQSYGVSVLLRAHRLTEKKEFLRCAEKAFECFFVTIDEGGLLNTDDGLTLFEESPVRPVDTVLNGFIFSIWGVLEYAQTTGDPRAQKLYDASAESLLKILPKFDSPIWSNYSTKPGRFFAPIASPHYHRVHIAQLTAMHLITGQKIFADYAQRWEERARSWWKKKAAVALKVGYKLFNT
jgi:hypothetical protein